VSWLERRLIENILHRSGSPPVEIGLWDGTEIVAANVAPIARLTVRSRAALLKLLADAEFQLAECYCSAEVEIEGDLVELLTALDRVAPAKPSWRTAWAHRLGRYDPSVPLVRARSNAAHHYDLGNDFYALWLDPTMTYTCAYFDSPDVTLEQAQQAKLELVCRKLALAPGERVVEAGSGWGSLALHMAERHGVYVDAYNVSAAQVAYARERAKEKGLSDRVRFFEADYREISGRYDAFVSVGMLEHVGRRHYRDLGRVMRDTVHSGGRGLLHSIGRDRPMPTNRWIQRRIFPEGYVPSLREIVGILEPLGLSVLDVENLRPHYERTLEHWLERFESARDEVAAKLGDRFVRMWRLYLASSLASFRTGWHQLFQVVYAPNGGESMPWTRARRGARSRDDGGSALGWVMMADTNGESWRERTAR